MIPRPETMQPKQPKAPRSGLTRFFLRGLVTLAPAVLTIVVFGLLVQMTDRYVTGPINRMIYWSLDGNVLGWKVLQRVGIDPLDKAYLDPTLLPIDLQDRARAATDGFSDARVLVALDNHREDLRSFFVDLDGQAIHAERLRDDVQKIVPPWVGIAISFLLVLWLGWLMGGFVGRRIVQKLDQVMHVVPVVNAVYPYSKQLVEFFFGDHHLEFDRVVAIPYPSPHLLSLAFITSNSLKSLREATGKQMVTVFIPSSPMPMTGYTIFVEAKDVIPLSISVDEALRITMTGGVLIPPREKIRGDLPEEISPAGTTRRKEESA